MFLEPAHAPINLLHALIMEFTATVERFSFVLGLILKETFRGFTVRSQRCVNITRFNYTVRILPLYTITFKALGVLLTPRKVFVKAY